MPFQTTNYYCVKQYRLYLTCLSIIIGIARVDMKSRITRLMQTLPFYRNFRMATLSRKGPVVLSRSRTDHASTAIILEMVAIANTEDKHREETAITITTHATSRTGIPRIVREMRAIPVKDQRTPIILGGSRSRSISLPIL